MTKTIHPGAFAQLTTGPYKAVLWGDEVSIPAFMVERIEGETVHCYYPPYSFQWPLSDLVAVERPKEYGANHDDWIRDARFTFTYATEYESEFDDDLGLVFSMTFGSESLAWNDETLHEQAWPFIATVANMVDPGTFGSQYLFTAAERHLADQGA